MEGRLILLALMAFVTPGMAQTNNTWSGCGSSQLCVISPYGCSPQNHTCLFGSVTNVSMTNASILSFTLKGHSSGYITLVLREPSMNSAANFTCGHNASSNNSFYFSSTLPSTIMINSQGSVNGDLINCTFNFTLPNISSMFNTSDLDMLNISLSSFPPSPTIPPTNGTAATIPPTNSTGATNTTTNGTATTNTTTTTTTTLMPATTKPTGASVALHPYASLLLLSLVTLCILQKV